MPDGTIVPATPVSPERTTGLPLNHSIFATTIQRAKQEQEQETLAQPYKTAPFRTFTNPMNIYFERREAVKIDNTLRRFHEETVLTDSTTATEIRLGLEETAGSELIEDLVRRISSEYAVKNRAEYG